MKNKYSITILKILGVVIMLLAFPIMPEDYPWYSSVLLYNTGVLLLLISKWDKFKKELGMNKKTQLK